jgi:hypothetical protein
MSARRQLLEAGDAEIHLKLRLSDVRRRVELLSYYMEPAYLVVSDLMVSEAWELFARMRKNVIELSLDLRKSFVQIQSAKCSQHQCFAIHYCSGAPSRGCILMTL